ncbi:protein kinase domain-containing protein [Leptolyngbya sp. 7M]|uniref:protein kinase domain-containing protein n=1 Tax=Leptolyngbya sp. 7M TaxID=2812896 RepID=UPI001B8BB72E|nr:protein kinase [Leptolyngbya sp. 7M]QYO66125.1 protein kinase [Leptolyngbya sp. 7M]
MSPERWRKLESIFDKAIEMPVGERKAFLDSECGDDDEIKEKVEELLRAEASVENFIESPVWTDSGVISTRTRRDLSRSVDNGFENLERDLLIGTKIGRFELKQELGRGGMGAVYLAERVDGEFRQRVAIKLIKRGMDSDFVIRRFRHERQILASFEHPYIARLIDGGTREDGTPYFIMEFIEGETLYNFADKVCLGIEERLQLFARICSAIEYAHQRKIVHRDIKPSNILVNKDGDPKLLDFGIAKVLDPNLVHESVNPTASMLRLMTPDYASPEQVKGESVTQASDIYSLGILLYELISGHRPYDLSGKALHEITYAICEEEPLPPSRAIGLAAHLQARYAGIGNSFASVRSSDAASLVEAISGNLDNIVMKAIAKNPGQRYGSVGALLDDVAKHLAGRPVSADRFDLRTTRSRLFSARDDGDGRSLAVLPFSFVNLAADEDTADKFLGIGIADAVTMRLSKIRRLIVRPTSSVLPFADSAVDPQRAGEELGVEFILTGNIKKASDRLRVTVQLLNVKENAAVWATSIDEGLADVLSLEDTLSTRVAEALLPQLTGRELADLAKRGTDIPEAYEHYIRGKFHFNSFTEDGFAKAFVCFHSAITADPEYALAYIGLADYYSWLGIMGILPPQECFQPAIKAASTAVQLDDELSEAHATLGFALHAGNYDSVESVRHLRRALILNPSNAKASVWYSIVLFTLGRFEEGLQFAREGLELDPLTPFNHHNLAWGLYYARRFQESADEYRRVIANFPEYPFGYFGLSKVLRVSGHTEEALQISRKARDVMGDSILAQFGYAESLAANAEITKAEAELKRIVSLENDRYISAYYIALVRCHLAAKDTDRSSEHVEAAFSALKTSYLMNDAWLNWLSVEPVFDILRDDDRYRQLVDDLGYSDPDLAKLGTRIANDTAFGPVTSIHDRPTILVAEGQNTDAPNFEGEKNLVGIRRRWLAVAVASVFLLGILTLLYYRPWMEETTGRSVTQPIGYQRPSLIIAPFRSTQSPGLGIGLADALSQRLGVVNELEVISSNTSRAIAKGDLMSEAKAIGVSFVVNGTLGNANSDLFLDAELIDIFGGRKIWSERFFANGGGHHSLQKQVSLKILETVGIQPQPLELRQIEKSQTDNAAAYQEFLIGRSQMAMRTSSGLRDAIISFSNAVSSDPEFALAYVGLSDAYSLLNLYDTSPPPNAYDRAREYVSKALKIDDELAEAHASLAYIKFFDERDRAAAELEFRRAIQMNPSYAQAHHWFALTLGAMRKPMDAIGEIRMAEKLDPRSLSVRTAAAMVLFFDEKYQDAMDQVERVLADDPAFVPALKVKRWILSATGKHREAATVLEDELENAGGSKEDPSWHIIYAQVADPVTEKDLTLSMLERAVLSPSVSSNDRAFAFETALAFNHLGMTQKALEFLERAEKAGSHSFNLMDADPRFKNLRSEPRYQRLLEKLGVVK